MFIKDIEAVLVEDRERDPFWALGHWEPQDTLVLMVSSGKLPALRVKVRPWLGIQSLQLWPCWAPTLAPPASLVTYTCPLGELCLELLPSG